MAVVKITFAEHLNVRFIEIENASPLPPVRALVIHVSVNFDCQYIICIYSLIAEYRALKMFWQICKYYNFKRIDIDLTNLKPW
jgi:hypothetical protein